MERAVERRRRSRHRGDRGRGPRGRLPRGAVLRPEADYTIDIVSRVGEDFAFEDLAVDRVPAGDVTVTVVTPETLYRMKRDTVPLRDRDDAERLARAYGFA